MSSSKTDWNALPPELQHAIARRVEHPASLANMRRTSNSMRAAANDHDIWEAAHHQHPWTMQHPPANGLTPHAAFARDLARERQACVTLGDSIHATRKLLAMRGPAARHTALAVHGGVSVSGLTDKLSDLEAKRQVIVDAFKTQGLRAKPFSLRQRFLRWALGTS